MLVSVKTGLSNDNFDDLISFNFQKDRAVAAAAAAPRPPGAPPAPGIPKIVNFYTKFKVLSRVLSFSIF